MYKSRALQCLSEVPRSCAEVKIKAPKKVLSRAEKKKAKKVREMKRARGEEVSDTDEDEV